MEHQKGLRNKYKLYYSFQRIKAGVWRCLNFFKSHIDN